MLTKKSGVAILISQNIEFMAKGISRNKECNLKIIKSLN